MQIYAFSLSFLLIFNAFSQNNLERVIVNFEKDPVNKNAKISFLAINLQNDEIIADINANKSLTAASTTKLFPTATAIEVLGSNKKTITRIYYSGEINSKGELNGDIWIRGGGDVSLGSKYFSKETQELQFLNDWADSLLQKGIKKINGSVIADASEFGYNGAPKGWHESDIGNYYGAFAGGLNFYDNTIKLILKTNTPGTKAQLIEIFPKVPSLSISNTVLAAKVQGDEASIFGAPFSLNRKITGELPANRERFIVKGSMPDPENLLVQELVKTLELRGLLVSGGSKTVRLNHLSKPNYEQDLKLLFQQNSKTIKEIAFWTNFKSVNLFAEGLVNLLGFYSNGDGSTNSGLKIIGDFWKDKINTSNLILNDGSGLSRLNAISAQHFCELLKYMSTSKNYDDFKSTFPLAGKNGTISTLCKGGSGEGRVFAKSGTLNNTKSYAGYIDSKTGKKIAFAVIVNDFSCSSGEIKDKIETILNSLSEY
jgi:D-alanyl-D-alanine carboxypeptidase/D-alanyl-D-alanine-endopeptidase (penicillin-binding protein 4)